MYLYNFDITKRHVTVKADDVSIKNGSKLPAFSYTVKGFLKDDGSALDGTSEDQEILEKFVTRPVLSCNVKDTGTPGEYTIRPSGAYAGPNYLMKYETGTLTVLEEDQVTITGIEVFNKIYDGQPAEFKINADAYVELEDNQPGFTKEEMTLEAFEDYSELDYLGRCGVAYANICLEIMPTEPRGDIGQVKPSGWQTVKYDCVDGKYLYNRCHLIGYQLAGENANKQNLITGTRYMNVEGMLPFENMVDGYVEETGNHVLYRVTPVFEGRNLLASGVKLEAFSVEDEGEGICFNVYIYNVQPGITIDYATGESWLEGETGPASQEVTYILNTSSKKFHLPDCASAQNIQEENRVVFLARIQAVLSGYEPCGRCKP